MIRLRKTRLSAAVVLGVAAVMTPLAALAGPASAATSSPGPNTLQSVPSGINVASLPGATVFGNTPADTPETVSFVLRERNINALKASVTLGVRNYLSVSQFASALSVTQHQYHVPALAGSNGFNPIPAQDVHGTAQSPLLPYRLSHFVLAILGLTNYAPYSDNAKHVNTSVVKPDPLGASACLKLTGLPSACNLPADVASRYGLDGLYVKGADGSGQTLAIV